MPPRLPGPTLSRREWIAGAATLGALPALAYAPDGLAAAAGRIGIAYGSAAVHPMIERDPDYAAALARECGLLVCENATKMDAVLPRPDLVSYAAADATLAFATRHRMRMRGHTLIWHEAIPAWVRPRIAGPGAETFLRQWITSAAGHFRGRFESWDAVNEIVAPEEGRGTGCAARPGSPRSVRATSTSPSRCSPRSTPPPRASGTRTTASRPRPGWRPAAPSSCAPWRA